MLIFLNTNNTSLSFESNQMFRLPSKNLFIDKPQYLLLSKNYSIYTLQSPLTAILRTRSTLTLLKHSNLIFIPRRWSGRKAGSDLTRAFATETGAKTTSVTSSNINPVRKPMQDYSPPRSRTPSPEKQEPNSPDKTIDIAKIPPTLTDTIKQKNPALLKAPQTTTSTITSTGSSTTYLTKPQENTVPYTIAKRYAVPKTFNLKTVDAKQYATDGTGKHIAQASVICDKPNCNQVNCKGLCGQLKDIDLSAHYTHKPLPNAVSILVDQVDIVGKQKPQHIVKAQTPTKISAEDAKDLTEDDLAPNKTAEAYSKLHDIPNKLK